MRRFTFYILIALLTFEIGSFIASKFIWQKESQTIVQNIQEPSQEIVVRIQNSLPQKNEIVFNKDDECKEWSDEVDYQPIINKWLRGENLKKVPYCSKTGKKTEDYNPSNIMPTLIDLNKDGKNELALQSLCSPTGNCAMEIFERKNKVYRKIFTEVRGVSRFELEKFSNKGFLDISTKMHGSWNSGDGIIYRYNGEKYKPHKCFFYEYKEYKDKNGEAKVKDIPKITYAKCSTFL